MRVLSATTPTTRVAVTEYATGHLYTLDLLRDWASAITKPARAYSRS